MKVIQLCSESHVLDKKVINKLTEANLIYRGLSRSGPLFYITQSTCAAIFN